MKILIIFFILSELLFCQSKIYTNSALGLRFDYSDSEYSPFSFHDSARTKNLDNWTLFSSKTLGISFKYPDNIFAKEDELASFYGKSINDSCVYLGVNNTLDESKFYTAIVIYNSSRTFEEIADDHFFEIYSRDNDSSWVILGRQGLPMEAIYFVGNSCIGLRGETFIGFYHCEGGYAGLGSVYRTLLVFDNFSNSKLVLFLDSAGITDCIEAEGVPDIEIWEDEFFKIASTIKKL